MGPNHHTPSISTHPSINEISDVGQEKAEEGMVRSEEVVVNDNEKEIE